MPPVAVAFPDCFTRLGGNQYINYINSASMGAWEDFLLHEMLTAVEQRFGCGTGRRAVFGKSSRGYRGEVHLASRPAARWQHAVIVDVEAPTAVRQAEVTAAKRMIERAQIASTCGRSG